MFLIGKNTKSYFSFGLTLILFCTSRLFSAIAIENNTPCPEKLIIYSVTKCFYDKSKFTRISEYFTGIEDTGGDTLLRTDPDCRSGLYLVININKPICTLGPGAFLHFKYVLSGCKKVQEKCFSLDSPCGFTRWIYLGITGADLCGGLVAWSIEIHSKADCVIQNSYLWSCP